MLGADASELYAKNQYNLLALMMKDNVITIDWDDEVLACTALTHDGKIKDVKPTPQANPADAHKHKKDDKTNPAPKAA
jgi:NAD(P) transhydrogenase subunit alpha